MSPFRESIFISYAQADRGYAEAVEHALESVGKVVWSDKRIAAGDDWDSEIQNALRSASVVVLIVSADSLSSQFVNYELGSAIAARIPVIPVLVREVGSLPKHLRHIQAVDARALDSASIGSKVAEAVEKLTSRHDT